MTFPDVLNYDAKFNILVKIVIEDKEPEDKEHRFYLDMLNYNAKFDILVEVKAEVEVEEHRLSPDILN